MAGQNDITVTLVYKHGGTGKQAVAEYVELGHIAALPRPNLTTLDTGVQQIKLSSDNEYLLAIKQAFGALPLTISPVRNGWSQYDPTTGTGGILVTYTADGLQQIWPYVEKHMATRGRQQRVKQIQQRCWPIERQDTMPDALAAALLDIEQAVVSAAIKHADSSAATAADIDALQRLITSGRQAGTDTSVLEQMLKATKQATLGSAAVEKIVRQAVAAVFMPAATSAAPATRKQATRKQAADVAAPDGK